MNKNNIKNAVIVLAFIMITINFFNIYNMKKELKYLRNDNSSFENNIQNSIRDIQYAYRNVEELIKKDQSIFLTTSVDFKLQDNKLAVTMQAFPKEISNTEKLVAKITADGKVYEQEADENNQAVILVDIAETIKPMFIIKSDAGLRQESLDELYTSDIFTVRVFSEWDNESETLEDKMILNLWITSNENTLPFTKNDIEKAEFIITDIGILEEQNSNNGDVKASSSTMAAPVEGKAEDYFNKLQGDRIPATKLPGEEKYVAGYSADFSEYLNSESGKNYEIYFNLTTKDGMQYITPYNSVASFSVYKGGRSSSSGSEILRPIFK